MTIRSLFDSSKQIDRRIEKVIQYDNIDPKLLRQEVEEYQITDKISQSFDKLLDAIDRGMGDGTNEIGVWVSGFYGSGKSSFTKYLGFALDPSVEIDGKPFLRHLQDRFEDQMVRQRLATVAARYKPAVIMLDLASEQLTGASMAEISDVLYAKVMQWAGYSRDRKAAYLEFMLERDNKLEAFEKRIQDLAEVPWKEIRNQPLVANQLASQLAPEFYPQFYKDSKSFHDQKLDEAIKTDDQARDMIDIARRRSGRENIIFILDEVGQYVAARDALILNLDGLAKNLKQIGKGKVWLMATAQQTLTEDDPRAQVNTSKLFKLKDRFPIQADLEASDIREICYRRLLGKSPEGNAKLEELFDRHGQQLRFHTKLENTRYYQADLSKKDFVQLYPFLPQHFDILLELLARLAKATGGVGLRSAIKVIQDVLINKDGGEAPLADRPLGTLATAVTFYDTLRRDILRSHKYVVDGVDRAVRSFGPASQEALVAKTVATLQILEDFPVSRENVAALIFPSADASSQLDWVKTAVGNLIAEPTVPLNEVDGSLRFMSEAVSALETERRGLIPPTAERYRIFNKILEEVFQPLPRTSLQGTRNVQCGIRARGVAGYVSLAGDKDEIQMLVDFVPAAEYETTKAGKIVESMQPISEKAIFLLAPELNDGQQTVEEIYRCDEIFSRNRNKSLDKESGDYLTGQQQRAQDLRGELAAAIRDRLYQGSFLFRGQQRAVATLGANLEEGCRKELGEVAQQVFKNYADAAFQAETSLAEKFLLTDRLDRIESQKDPLSLVTKEGRIKVTHAALVSILDVLRAKGSMEGRDLLDLFNRAPYGWSKDTIRYLVAALLTAGEIKLRVSGEDITVRGEVAIESLRTNNAFGRVGVSLRSAPIPSIFKERAAKRLEEITGTQVLPIEDEISRAVSKRFLDLQRDYGPLAPILENLGLPGADRIERIKESISEILKGDASDATTRMGTEVCELYDDLLWAREVSKRLDQNLVDTIKAANRYLLDVELLPDGTILDRLKEATSDSREKLRDYLSRESFYETIVELQSEVSRIESAVSEAAGQLSSEYSDDLQAAKIRLESMPEWQAIGGTTQEAIAASLDGLQRAFPRSLDGIQQCISARYPLQQRVASLEAQILRTAREQAEAAADEPAESGSTGPAELTIEDFTIPKRIGSLAELEALIERLQALKARFRNYTAIVFGPTQE